MIKKCDDLRVDTVTGLMGGEGELKRVHFMEVEDFKGKGRLFCRFTIKPGDSIGYHKHEGEQEGYYILKGEALFNDNGTEVILKSGDFGLCLDGECHSIKNIGQEDLEFIALIPYTTKAQ
jgi:mannose-6-phosphate isomerase-like protein (cupin superfamily)